MTQFRRRRDGRVYPIKSRDVANMISKSLKSQRFDWEGRIVETEKGTGMVMKMIGEKLLIKDDKGAQWIVIHPSKVKRVLS